MARHEEDRETVPAGRLKRDRGGTTVILLLVFAAFMGLLYAAGFWNADLQASGASHPVTVSAAGGYVPDLDVNSTDRAVVTGGAVRQPERK